VQTADNITMLHVPEESNINQSFDDFIIDTNKK